MARSLIRGYSQIMSETIKDAQIATDAAIQTSKLADGLEFLKRDGSVALTGNLDAASFTITNLVDGVNPQDAATVNQLQAVSAGLDPKESVRVAADANIDLATGGLLTIDGVTVVDGDRVLVMGQTVPTENGIYNAAAGAWVRAEDSDGTPANEVSGGNYVFVETGTVYEASGWTLVADGNIAIGTDDINWTQFTGAAQINAGDGISKTGNVLDVNVADGVEIISDALQVKLDGSTLSKSAAGVKLADLTSGNILVGNASNIATGVAMSGDVTIDNTGTATISAGAVSNVEIAAGAAIDTSKLAQGAEFLQRDGSVVWTGVQDAGGTKLSNLGDGTLATDAATLGQVQGIETNLQTEIDAIEAGAGLSAAGAYQVNATSNYIKATDFATASLTASLNSADLLLDGAIKQVADDLAALGTGSIDSLQTEVDAIETSIGTIVATDGTWVGFTGTNYLDASADLRSALTVLDTQVKTDADNLAAEILATNGDVTAMQTEIDAIETGSGLAADGTFVPFAGTNFIDASTSLANAISILDTGVQSALDAKLDDSQLIDDDTFTSATATNIPSAESVKTYVDNSLSGQAVGFVDDEVPTGTIDGANTAFTLAATPDPISSVKLFHNGQRLRAGASNDFTVSGTAITMNFAPEAGDQLWADYRI